MFFAQRTRQWAKVITGTLVAYLLFIALLSAFFPERSGSFSEAFLRWLVVFPVGLIAWFAVEWCGTKFLSISFWQRLSNTNRVLLLVVLIVVATGSSIWATTFFGGRNAL